MYRDEFKFVVDNSKYVKINEKAIDNILDKLDFKEYNHWFNDFNLKLIDREKIIFFFLGESMNFCFWKKPKWYIEYHNNKYKGSIALFYSLVREVENNPLFLDINYLSKITIDDLEKVFATITVQIPHLDKRYECFIDTVNVIKNRGESFYTELYNCKSDIELTNYIKDNFKYFRDESIYKSKKINFNKRVNLLILDLYELIPDINKNINNVNSISGCDDYVIPRILRELNILEYHEELASIISNEIELLHDSEMEIEIRANMLYALELIKDKLKEKNIEISSAKLDGIIWALRDTFSFKNPHHNTVTIYY